jgi:hypothetical protein
MDQSIQPMYFPLLDDPMSPSVRNLQHTLETAWKDGKSDYNRLQFKLLRPRTGYDADGAKDLKHKVVGTKKWIGTAGIIIIHSFCWSMNIKFGTSELYTAFTYRSIP